MKALMVVLGILCCSVIATGQDSDRDSSVSVSLRTLEVSRFDAQLQKDSGALNAIFDDTLLLVDANGSLWTKAAFLSNVLAPGVALQRVVPVSMTVRVFGNVAIVIGLYEQKGVKAGHPFVQRCRFVDTWALKHGKWLCIAVTTTTIS